MLKALLCSLGLASQSSDGVDHIRVGTHSQRVDRNKFRIAPRRENLSVKLDVRVIESKVFVVSSVAKLLDYLLAFYRVQGCKSHL